jgi:hypothetical protein
MGYMAIRHYQAIIAHFRFPAIIGATVNGYKLPDSGIIAYFQKGFLIIVIKILWYCSQAFHNGYVTAHPCAFSNFNVFVDNSEGVNFYILCQPGIGVYVCMWMNHESLLIAIEYFLYMVVKKKTTPNFQDGAKLMVII